MENYYKKIQKRTEEKPRLMLAIVAVFYFLIGMGFTGIRFNTTITMITSCCLCLYMSTMVFAMVKGVISKALLNCGLFFALGLLFKFMMTYSVLTYMDLAIALGLFVLFFGLGLLIGSLWYGKYIKN